MSELKLRDKLIAFPEDVLETLAEYKKKTGVSASNYVRNATIRRMIQDGLIWFRKKTIIVETEKNGKKLIDQTDAIESNKFCDSDGKCELPVILEKR